MNKNDKLVLKGIIKGLASEGNRTRKFINASVEDRRAGHWQTKRAIGAEARAAMLAYAFLCERPYYTVEPNTDSVNNPIDMDRLMAFVRLFRSRTNYDELKAWLNHPVPASSLPIEEAKASPGVTPSPRKPSVLSKLKDRIESLVR